MNCFNSGYNAFEFVFEFGQYFPAAATRNGIRK